MKEKLLTLLNFDYIYNSILNPIQTHLLTLAQTVSDHEDRKADKDDILAKDNSTEYTPTSDYHPATKKYVDENNGGENEPVLLGIIKGSDKNELVTADFTISESCKNIFCRLLLFSDSTYTAAGSNGKNILMYLAVRGYAEGKIPINYIKNDLEGVEISNKKNMFNSIALTIALSHHYYNYETKQDYYYIQRGMSLINVLLKLNDQNLTVSFGQRNTQAIPSNGLPGNTSFYEPTTGYELRIYEC